MANYIDPLANAELQRTLAFARARETYPGLRGELLLEICEAAWERSAGDPSDGGALVRFESALDLIARQYRIGGGRLSVSEVAQTAIPATALNPYLRAGAKRIAEDERAAENAAAVPINPTFGDRLARVPRLAPAPLGITLAASVFGVAAAAQAGVLPDTPITPSHHTASHGDSGSAARTADASSGGPAPIAPAATSPGPESFLAASHAASQAAPGEWQATNTGGDASGVTPAPAGLASPGAVSGVETTSAPAAVPSGGTTPVSYTAPAAPAVEEVQPAAPVSKPSHPPITIDLNGGGVQVGVDDDGANDTTDDKGDEGQNDQNGSGDQQKPVDTTPVDTITSGVIQIVDPATGEKHPAIKLPTGQVIPLPGGSAPAETPAPAPAPTTDTGTDTDADSGDVDTSPDTGSTDPVEGSDGDEESGDPAGTDQTLPPDDGSDEAAPTDPGTPPADTPAAARTQAPAPTPAPAQKPAVTPPATPAPATPPATTPPAAPATATPAPAAPATAAAAAPAPATPAPGA